MYLFAIKTKNAKIKLHKIEADTLEEAQEKAKSIIVNSVSLDDMDYNYINETTDWNLVVKRMSNLKKPISDVELL